MRIAEIYDRVQRQVYLFLAATLMAILLTSLYLIRSNRQLFAQLAALSDQRSELAQKLIATQESTLRHISRELHDEFGQILTAMGSMLARAGNQAPEGSPLRADLREVGEIAQTTLDNVRSLSQALHPVMLDEAGLESTLDWYLPVVERQAGIHISYEKSGTAYPVDGNAAIHVYRVVQEALNNVTRHSGAREAWVRLRYLPRTLELEVEDHGSGFVAQSVQAGHRAGGDARARANCWAARSSSSRPRRRHAGSVDRAPGEYGGKSGRKAGVTCRIRFPSCWWTITAWCGAASAACSKTSPTSRSSGEASDGEEAVRLAHELKPARHRDGLRHAGHERAGWPRGKILEQQPQTLRADAQHALRGDAGAAGARGGRARLHPEERRGPRPGGGDPARGGGRDRARLAAQSSGDAAERRARPSLTPRELEILQLICRRQVQQGDRHACST